MGCNFIFFAGLFYFTLAAARAVKRACKKPRFLGLKN